MYDFLLGGGGERAIAGARIFFNIKTRTWVVEYTFSIFSVCLPLPDFFPELFFSVQEFYFFGNCQTLTSQNVMVRP